MTSIRLAAAAAVSGVLALAGFPPPAFSSSADHARATTARATTAAASGALLARLKISSTHPPQLQGILLDASASSGPIIQYVFDYGDGITETGNQPLALHGYRNTGTYRARVTVVSAAGQRATSASVTIHVRDGIAPVVRINSPHPSQVVHLGPAGVHLSGVATDAGGVREVQLAIELVSSKRHLKTGGLCIWYDGHVWLVLTGCSSPFFFRTQYSHHHWSFTIPSNALIPPGTYVVRARAVDRAGNVSNYYALVLRTILPFRLRP